VHFSYEVGGFEETPVSPVSRACSCDVDGRAAVNGTHECRFAAPIYMGELDDAESIDPEILETERVSDVDSIAEGLCEFVFWDRDLEVF
jgi:hypothetical protein